MDKQIQKFEKKTEILMVVNTLRMACKWLLLLLIRWMLNVIIHSFLVHFRFAHLFQFIRFGGISVIRQRHIFWVFRTFSAQFHLSFSFGHPYTIHHTSYTKLWILYNTIRKRTFYILIYWFLFAFSCLVWFGTLRVKHFNFRSSQLWIFFLSASSASLKHIENTMDEDVPG